MWLVNNRNLFMTILKDRKSKIKAPEISVSVERAFHEWHLWGVLLWGKGRKTKGFQSSSSFLYKGQ
jgi:hypothetical protein